MTQQDSVSPDLGAGGANAPSPLLAGSVAPAKPVVQGLGAHASRGLMWGMAQSFISKIVGFGLQIILAKLLVEEDFGLVAMTTTVTAVTALIQDPGIRTILISRQARFDRWATAAFWMSTILGTLAALVICAAAPFVARAYNEPRVIGLLLVVAMAAPLGAMSTVTDARLQIDLRFRFRAQLAWWSMVVHSILSVLLAWQHFGPYSFVIPAVVVSLCKLVVQWSYAKVKIRPRLELRRWPFLLKDARVIFLSGIFAALLWQGDYMMLGLFHSTAVVGIYFFAFNLSTQTMRLLTDNLTVVLFPVLSRVQGDPERQVRAYVRAAKMLGIIGLPICVLQAVVAEPIFAILFKAKWQPSMVVMQLLCLGMSMRMVGASCSSLMAAQGKFGRLLHVNIGASLSFVAMVGLASWWADAEHAPMAAAAAAAIHFAALGPVQLWVGIRVGGGKPMDLVSIMLPPILMCLPAMVAGWLIGQFIPVMPGRAWAQLVLMSSVFTGVYVGMVRWWAPEQWREISGHASSMLARVMRIKPTGPTTAVSGGPPN